MGEYVFDEVVPNSEAGGYKIGGAAYSGASAEEAGDLAADGTEAPSDLNASKDYREHLARVLVRRGLQEAGR